MSSTASTASISQPSASSNAGSQKQSPPRKKVKLATTTTTATTTTAAAATSSQPVTQNPLRVLEFFSGIGGWHTGFHTVLASASTLTSTSPSPTTRRKNTSTELFKVVGAFDVNPNANVTYQHNFPDVPVNKSDIKKLTVRQLESYHANVWVMSPPCQPHTRNGQKRDAKDPRSFGFLNLMEVLRHMTHPPKLFFLENVEGFENSESHHVLLNTFKELATHYHTEEYILSPTQFGTPNQRDRYYFIAWSRDTDVHVPARKTVKAPVVAPPTDGRNSTTTTTTTTTTTATATGSEEQKESHVRRFLVDSGCHRIVPMPKECRPGSAMSPPARRRNSHFADSRAQRWSWYSGHSRRR